MESGKNQSPTIKLSAAFNAIDFAKLARSERDPRKCFRLAGLGILQQKKSLNQTVQLFKVARKTMRGWVRTFEKFGLEGLNDKKRSGRPPRLARDKWPAFAEAVVKLQEDRKGGRITGKDIQKMAEEKFGAILSLDRIYTLLNQLNIVWITGRSRHPKANEAAQEDFKKNLQPRLNQSCQKTSPRIK